MSYSDISRQKFEFFKPFVKEKRVLDVGIVDHSLDKTEEEDWLHSLIKKDASYCLGIDILDPEIKTLQERGFDVKIADVENLDLGETFDIIVVGDVIEHLRNQKGFLESCYKHLHDNGTLLITTPNSFGIYYFLGNLLKGRYTGNPDHTCWFDAMTITHLLDVFKFSVERIEYMEIIYDSETTILAKYPLLRKVYLFLNKLVPKRFQNTMCVVAKKR